MQECHPPATARGPWKQRVWHSKPQPLPAESMQGEAGTVLLHWLATRWEFQLWKLPPYFFLLESDLPRSADSRDVQARLPVTGITELELEPGFPEIGPGCY